MPVYTYRCKQCGRTEEAIHAAGSRSRLICEVCGALLTWQFPSPNLRTDTTFRQGTGTLLDQCGGNVKEAEKIVAACRRQGGNPGYNDYYLPGVAQSMGDPEAFVPAGEGRDYVKKLCRKRGTSCRGLVEVEAPDRPPVKNVPLAESVIRRMTKKAVKADPSLAAKPQELRESIIDRHRYRGAE